MRPSVRITLSMEEARILLWCLGSARGRADEDPKARASLIRRLQAGYGELYAKQITPTAADDGGGTPASA